MVNEAVSIGQSNDSTPVSLQRLEESHHHLNVHWPMKKVLKMKTIPVHLHLIIMCIIKVLQQLLFLEENEVTEIYIIIINI